MRHMFCYYSQKQQHHCNNSCDWFRSFFSFQKVPSIKDFSIIKIISRGAFGQVFLGYKNTDESKLFAIKVSYLSYSWMYDWFILKK